MDRIIAPLCTSSLPCFTVCANPLCREKPFMCARQNCKCQFLHLKCQQPLNWKSLFESIRSRGYGTPELKAYYQMVGGLISKIILDLTRQNDKLVLHSLSAGLEPAQKDLASAIMAGQFDSVTPKLVSRAAEQLKLPGVQLNKPKTEIDSILEGINKAMDNIMADIRQLCAVKLSRLDAPKQQTMPRSFPTVNPSNNGGIIPTMPRIQTMPPNPQTNPVYGVQKGYQDNARKLESLSSTPHQPRQPLHSQTMASSSPPSVSVSNALRQLQVTKQEPPTMSASSPIQESPASIPNPPTTINKIPPTNSVPIQGALTQQPSSQPTSSANKPQQDQSKLREFIQTHALEMQVQGRKHSPTDSSYDTLKVTYLKLKGCSYIQAKLLSKCCPNLTKLSLYNCYATKEGVTAIADNLKKLVYLDLTGNNIGDSGVLAIANGLPNLQILGLTGNEITDQGATIISQKLLNLVQLRLAYNKVSEAGAIKIAQSCQKLKGLDINNSKFSQQGKEAIRRLLPKRHLSL